MWRWLPINKVSAHIVLFSLLNALITANFSDARAQSNIGPNIVSSIKANPSRTSLVLQTSGSRKLSRPIIQFLQGENGTTVMVADFPGMVFPYATRVISVNAAPLAEHSTAHSASVRGIKLVRIGCYQESPPITRIAFVSNDVQKLKSISFNGAPGSLTIKWSKSGKPEIATAEQIISKANQVPTNALPAVPPFAPPIAHLDPSVASANSDTALSANRGRANSPEMDADAASSYYPLRPPIAEGGQRFSASPGATPPVRQSAGDRPAPSVASRSTEKASNRPAPAMVSQPAQQLSDRLPVKKDRSAPQAVSHRAPPAISSLSSNQNIAPPVVSHHSPAITQSSAKEADTADLEPSAGSAHGPGLIRSFLAKFKSKTKEVLSPDDQAEQKQPAAEPTSAPQRTAEQEQTNSLSNKLKMMFTPEKQVDADKQQQPASEDAGRAAEPPLITLKEMSAGSYMLKVTSPDRNELNFTSFRLHNPERFVIDFAGLRSIQTAQVPQPEAHEFLQSIRVGTPDPLKETGRLVLDLSSETVAVIPCETEGVNTVSLMVGRSSNPLSDLNAPPGATIVLDAGHGGSDPGAQRGYLKEKDLTLAIAEKTYELLTSHGVKVTMTRSNDTFIPLAERVSVTNTNKPDAFLSIHINSLESTSEIHGIETYYQTDMSKALAQSIHDSLVNELQAPDRSIRKARFYVINRAEVPAVLAEVGFISNKTERDKLASADYQEKIAGALAKGAILYLKQQCAVAKKISNGSVQNGVRSGFKTVSNSGGGRISSASRLAQKGLGIKRDE